VTADPYSRLLELAQSELELVLGGDFDALERIDVERTALVASLPPSPPPAARPALTAAAELQARTTAALEATRAQVAKDLAGIQRGHETARGYGRATASAPQRSTITVAA
jgi:hypothetical protein